MTTTSADKPSWRDAEPDQFAAAILSAAEQLGVLPLAIEKDYWVCGALRAITMAHPGEVIFKGGTSLEKLRIVKRFSEDLDLLVSGNYISNRAAERALKSMINAAATSSGGTATPLRSGGKPGSYHRSAYLERPMTHSGQPGAMADASAILLELGQSGGPNPNAVRPITSMLSRQLIAAGFDIGAWRDLSIFEVPVLHPGRTLIEKLLRVNNFTSKPGAQDSVHGWPRIGRQFYDIWALLGTGEVLEFLADRPLVAHVLASCFEVSEAFEPDLPVPRGGFAASVAFEPSGALATRLRREHQTAMRALYYGTEVPPKFDEVLRRIDANRHQLDIGELQSRQTDLGS
jgi:hypothetical protein